MASTHKTYVSKKLQLIDITNRGESIVSKGSRQRPTNKQSFDDNFDKIFNKKGQKTMSRMPCSITDDPYNDASDFFEGKGVYKPYVPSEADAEYDRMVEETLYPEK